MARNITENSTNSTRTIGEYMKLLLLLLFTVNANAAFNAFPPSPVPADSIVTKGGLLTSNGTAQVEALACADDEIIVYDSTEANGFKCAPAPTGGGDGKKCQAKFQTSNTTGEATGVRFSNLVVGEKYSVKYLVSGTAGIKRASLYVNGVTNDSLIVGQLRWNMSSVNNSYLTTRVFEVTQANTDVRLQNLSGQTNGSGVPWFATWAEICQEPSSTALVNTF